MINIFLMTSFHGDLHVNLGWLFFVHDLWQLVRSHNHLPSGHKSWVICAFNGYHVQNQFVCILHFFFFKLTHIFEEMELWHKFFLARKSEENQRIEHFQRLNPKIRRDLIALMKKPLDNRYGDELWHCFCDIPKALSGVCMARMRFKR